jgi:glycosyltransferase involved in cell wall biosynthesis
MNILFITHQTYPTGMAGTKRIKLFAEFLALNNNVKVLVLNKKNGDNLNKGIKDKVSFECIKFSYFQYFFYIKKIYKILKLNKKKNSKNILFIYDGFGITNFWFAILARKLGFKIVVDIVEDYSMHHENSSLIQNIKCNINNFLSKYTYLFCDGIVVISTRLKSKYLSMNIKLEKIVLIPISAENLMFNFNNQNIPKNNFIFLYSGSFGVKDGIKFLIEAFKLFSEEKNDVKLFLSGKINNVTLRMIKDDSKIEYKGMINEKDYYQFLNKADILLMTRDNSEYANSGFPFKLGEYLATGIPVIATNISDIRLYLKDKIDLIMASPSSVKSLLECMTFAYNNKNEIIKIGENGKQTCEKYFNPIANGNVLEKFLMTI